MGPTPTAQSTCSELSIQAGEPLIGSATPTSRYLLLEYGAAWGGKALEESDLPEAIKTHIQSWVKSDKQHKALLIHRPNRAGHERDPGDQVRLFLCSVGEARPEIFLFNLETYDRLLELDFAMVFNAPDEFQAFRRWEPIILVCTNGRRDRCCALHGIPLFNALEAASNDQPTPLVWQSTHQGGHRFAANVIALPHGLVYGRVEPAEAGELLKHLLAGKAYLPKLRGRAAYPPAAQAADEFLRIQTGETAVEAYRLESVEEAGADTWRVVFRGLASGKFFRLNVEMGRRAEEVYESCQLDKKTHLTRYFVKFD